MLQLELFSRIDREWRPPSGGHLRLFAQVARDEVVLRLDDLAPDGRVPLPITYGVTLKLRGAPACRVQGGADFGWPLGAGLCLGPRDDCDPFRVALAWGCATLAPESARQSMPLSARVRRSEAAGALHDILQALTRQAANQCEPAARSLARRFHRTARWSVYAGIEADDTGRMGQLARVCPGALLLCSALGRQSGHEGTAVVATFTRDIIAGRRLSKALDGLVEGWFTLGLMDALDEGCGGGAWHRLREGSPAERAQLRQEHRWLIAHVGPTVSALLLLVPHPARLIPEHLPRSPAQQRRWLEVTRAPALIALASTRPGLASSLALWLSKHALVLANQGDRPPQAVVADLASFVEGTHRTVSATTSAAHLVEDARQWSVQMAELRAHFSRYGRPSPLPSDAALDTPLPTRVGPYSSGDLTVTPLTTARALLNEAVTMRNCVAGRLSEALARRAYFFHATLHGRELTIEAHPAGPGLLLHEVRGTADRAPTSAEVSRVTRWLDEVASRWGTG
jgi:hypothetical protein